MCLRCCVCIPAWFESMARLCGHVGRRRVHTTMALVVGLWLLFVHRGLVHHDNTPF